MSAGVCVRWAVRPGGARSIGMPPRSAACWIIRPIWGARLSGARIACHPCRGCGPSGPPDAIAACDLAGRRASRGLDRDPCSSPRRPNDLRGRSPSARGRRARRRRRCNPARPRVRRDGECRAQGSRCALVGRQQRADRPAPTSRAARRRTGPSTSCTLRQRNPAQNRWMRRHPSCRASVPVA